MDIMKVFLFLVLFLPSASGAMCKGVCRGNDGSSTLIGSIFNAKEIKGVTKHETPDAITYSARLNNGDIIARLLRTGSVCCLHRFYDDGRLISVRMPSDMFDFLARLYTQKRNG